LGTIGKAINWRMRVARAMPGRLAMILENQDVPEALIVFQVEHAVPECPQDVLDLLFPPSSRECSGGQAFQ